MLLMIYEFSITYRILEPHCNISKIFHENEAKYQRKNLEFLTSEISKILYIL